MSKRSVYGRMGLCKIMTQAKLEISSPLLTPFPQSLPVGPHAQELSAPNWYFQSLWKHLQSHPSQKDCGACYFPVVLSSSKHAFPSPVTHTH